MKFGILATALATLIVVGHSSTARAAAQAAAQSGGASEAEIEASRAAIAAADVDRLLRDQAYASEILRHLDILDRATSDSRVELAIDTLRLTALSTVGQHDQIRTVIDRVLAHRSNSAEPYNSAWWAALSIPDVPRAVAVVEQASRLVPGVGRGELREALGAQNPAFLLVQLERDDDDATRLRLAEALFRIGWPGRGDLERANDLRMILLEYRVEQGDISDARGLASGLTDPVTVLPLLVLRRYDALFESDEARLARLRAAIADYDRVTVEALGAELQIGPAYDRARFLRSLGRDREALALLEPFTRDVPATVQADYRGMWAINQAAYILMSLGRRHEAVALMERLLALPIADNPDLVGPSINHTIILNEAERPADALAHADRLDREASQFANDYGKLVIAYSRVCSLAALDRRSEAEPLLQGLRAAGGDHPGPLMEAYICLGDLDAAEAVVIRRLEGDDPESLLIDFQDYQLQRDHTPAPDPMNDRLMSLRDRPAVRVALDRVGRVLPLPLAGTP